MIDVSQRSQVSILVPVYNEEAFLRQTLESIRQQEYRDFVCLISDNASTDNSLSIAREYASMDNRFIVFSQPENIGSARNGLYLFNQVGTKYCMFFSGHDLIAPNFLAKTIRVLDERPDVSMSFSYVHGIDKDGNDIGWIKEASYQFSGPPIQRYLDAILTLTNCTIAQSVFRSTDVSDFTFPVVRGPDHILISRLLWFGNLSIINEPLYFRRYFAEHEQPNKYKERIVGTRGATGYDLMADAWIDDFRKLYHGSKVKRQILEKIIRSLIEGRFYGNKRSYVDKLIYKLGSIIFNQKQ